MDSVEMRWLDGLTDVVVIKAALERKEKHNRYLKHNKWK